MYVALLAIQHLAACCNAQFLSTCAVPLHLHVTPLKITMLHPLWTDGWTDRSMDTNGI